MNKREAKREALSHIVALIDVSLYGSGVFRAQCEDAGLSEGDTEKVLLAIGRWLDCLRAKYSARGLVTGGGGLK